MNAIVLAAVTALGLLAVAGPLVGQTTRPESNGVTLTVQNASKAISPELFGVFFEDLNYAADGGLYAELVQNRSFEYQPTSRLQWNPTSFWTLATRDGGKGDWSIGGSISVHKNNPYYAVINVATAGGGVGLTNDGFDGIPVVAGKPYDVSLFAQQLYMNQRWGAGSGIEGKPMPIVLRLENKAGESLGEVKLEVVGRQWKRLAGSITATKTDPAARLTLLATQRGGIAVDDISLFPRDTFRNRPNGLRADLAQAIADLKPRFVRFPGGCLAHGDGINNIYNWKRTIGPIEQRRQQRNMWGYHQTVGLGYFEYFQFCEDIDAAPLPVVAAGVSCQNAGHVAGVGQQCIPLEDMPAYIQDTLDLIEWANGPATSTWGAKRAAAGHPEPFGLKYLGVGNEDHITPEFRERFKMIYDAVRAKHPEITVIGTSGPSPKGFDFDEGWKFAGELNVPMVDEHYYEKPDWFWANLTRYDGYDRTKSKVYLGEYAAHDDRRRSTLRSALAEAAYMTGLERNGDVVYFASYAPLLARRGHTQWTPDLIYFDNQTISPTINYAVQKLFGENAGDTLLPMTVTRAETKPAVETFAASCVRDGKTGDVIVKLVSRSDTPTAGRIDISALGKIGKTATCTVLAGEADAETAFGKSAAVVPTTKSIDVAGAFDYELPPHSFTVIRIKPAR